MLLGLLPAFRDLRAPLLAGYLSLLAAWLLFNNAIPSQDDATGAVKSLYRLSDVVGGTGVVAAVTALAFLVGSVVQFSAQAVGRRRNSARGGPQHDARDADALHGYLSTLLSDDKALGDVVGRALQSPDLSREEALARQIEADLPRIARRLRGDENELYDEYDRLIGEAELREITLIPLVLLIIALAITLSPACLVALAVTPVLKRQAVWQREAGNEVIIDAVIVGKVAAPALERFQRQAAASTAPE